MGRFACPQSASCSRASLQDIEVSPWTARGSKKKTGTQPGPLASLLNPRPLLLQQLLCLHISENFMYFALVGLLNINKSLSRSKLAFASKNASKCRQKFSATMAAGFSECLPSSGVFAFLWLDGWVFCVCLLRVLM